MLPRVARLGTVLIMQRSESWAVKCFSDLAFVSRRKTRRGAYSFCGSFSTEYAAIMWISVAIVCAALLALILKYVFTKSGPNPFEKDTCEPPRKIVPRKEKNKVLKQGKLKEQV